MKKKKKLIDKMALAKGQNCKSWSPQKIVKSKTSGTSNSFICRKSSQIHKMFPKSPTKFCSCAQSYLGTKLERSSEKKVNE